MFRTALDMQKKVDPEQKKNLKTLQRKFAAWAEPRSSVGPHGWQKKRIRFFNRIKKTTYFFNVFD